MGSENMQLSAGPLVMDFDPTTAWLRSLRVGTTEILRGIFAAVRDQDWNTLPMTIRNLQCAQRTDGFTLSFVAACLADQDVVFEWQGEIIGNNLGTVSFEFNGRVLEDFRKNRIGLCVLHPIDECAGLPCQVEHCDGSTSQGEFPNWISPHQPFKNIQAITHGVCDNLAARVAFAGEPFEMEDQRNWSDASFKTYSTPLELPFPVELKSGHRIRQTVTLELLKTNAANRKFWSAIDQTVPARTQPSRAATSPSPPHIEVAWDSARPMPPVGLGYTGHESADVVRKLAELQPAHLRVDVDLSQSHGTDKLEQAKTLAQELSCQLEVALFTDNFSEPQWAACERLIRQQPNLVSRWLVFHPSAKTTPSELTRGADILRKTTPDAPIVVGTNNYFAELNRNRPTVSGDSLICYSVNPQVHAFDNRSLVETLAAHRWMVESADHIFDATVVISPITLLPRFNPNATTSQNSSTDLPHDPRQHGGFGAAWTVGLLSHLAVHPRVASLTFYETSGPSGIMDSHGCPYPMFETFRRYCRATAVCDVKGSHPNDLLALALVDADNQRQLLVANLSSQAIAFRIRGRNEPEVLECDIQAECVVPLQLSSNSEVDERQ